MSDTINMDEWWSDVNKVLIEQHKITPDKASQLVTSYRHELESHNIYELIAHWDIDEIAESIAKRDLN